MELNADRLCLPGPFCMSIIDFRASFHGVSSDKVFSVSKIYGRSVRRFNDPRKYRVEISSKLCRNCLRIALSSTYITHRELLRGRREIHLERAACLVPFPSSSGATAFLRDSGFRSFEKTIRLATPFCFSETSNVGTSVLEGSVFRKRGRSSFEPVIRSFQLFIRGLFALMFLVFIGKVAVGAAKRNCQFEHVVSVFESVVVHMALKQHCVNEGIRVLRQHGAAMSFEDHLGLHLEMRHAFEDHLGLHLEKTELAVENQEEMHSLLQWPRGTTSGYVEHRTKSNAFVKIAAGKVSPAVVRLDTERICATKNPAEHDGSTHWFGDNLVRNSNEFVRERGMGSGFVVDGENGLIVTNLHVIDGAENVKVMFCDGRTFDAQIIGVDEVSDLGVVKVPNKAGELLPEAPLGNSKTVELGDWVIAIGNPFGLDNTISLGIISNLHRTASEVGISGKQFDLFQTDCAINPGSSGGPLVNEFGEVIGINTAIRADAEGIAFAIPINNVKHAIEALSKGLSNKHPYTGIEVSRPPDLGGKSCQRC